MTRFARAKGSKASNERVPEEATSWSEMKAQLDMKNKEIEDAKNREEFMNQRTANYKAFLSEKALQSNNSQWSVFPNMKVGRQNINNSVSIPKNKIKTSPEELIEMDKPSSDDEDFKSLKCKVDNVLNDMDCKRSETGVSDKARVEEVNLISDVIVKKRSKKPKSIVDEAQVHSKKMKKEDVNIKRQKYSPKNVSKNTELDEDSGSDAPPDEQSSKKEISAPIVKVKKIKKKKLKIMVNGDLPQKAQTEQKEQLSNSKTATGNNKQLKTTTKKRKIVEEGKVQEKIEADQVLDGKPSVEKRSKKKPKNTLSPSKQAKKKLKEDLTEEDLKKIEKKKQKRIKQVEKKKKLKELQKQEKLAAEQNISNQTDKSLPGAEENKIRHSNIGSENNNLRPPKTFNKTKVQAPKIRDKEEHKRKKPYLPHKMFINGKELEIDYVEGFPVKKEDADRLKKLRKEMIAKGLPGSEIKFALKLERRRAEKAFMREKKKVCFNCRKSGHNLSECPELRTDELAQTHGSGICFKCGSTEHTHFECKVVRGQEFKYAQCFICKEQGHISRQCPDNARGLYPKGGSCNVCGDVTHLKKDCPKYQAQQQRLDSGMQIETFGAGNPDVLDENSGNKFPVNIRQNKIVKF